MYTVRDSRNGYNSLIREGSSSTTVRVQCALSFNTGSSLLINQGLDPKPVRQRVEIRRIFDPLEGTLTVSY